MADSPCLLPVVIRSNRSHTQRVIHYLRDRFAAELSTPEASVHALDRVQDYIHVGEPIPVLELYKDPIIERHLSCGTYPYTDVSVSLEELQANIFPRMSSECTARVQFCPSREQKAFLEFLPDRFHEFCDRDQYTHILSVVHVEERYYYSLLPKHQLMNWHPSDVKHNNAYFKVPIRVSTIVQ
mmetsp:Transcript_13150/g.39742  ORF Transcript_13150/g.39742 Transcript_13150/m.39742 type:complete len:183 (-) Transcript_13150:733-1281(-)